MKLTTTDIKNLTNVLDACLLVGIENVIIEDSLVRGMNADKSCVILSDTNVPKLPLPLGLTRIKELKQRLDLFGDNVAVEVKEGARGDISSIDMQAGKSKASFRCASTGLIKAPKVISDTLINRVYVSKEQMKSILAGAKAMGSKKIAISIKKTDEVVFDMADTIHDNFSVTLDSSVERLDDADTSSVTHYYDEPVFASIMRTKQDDKITFDVGSMGIIRVDLNGHAMTILPKINEDGDDNE